MKAYHSNYIVSSHAYIHTHLTLYSATSCASYISEKPAQQEEDGVIRIVPEIDADQLAINSGNPNTKHIPGNLFTYQLEQVWSTYILAEGTK